MSWSSVSAAVHAPGCGAVPVQLRCSLELRSGCCALHCATAGGHLPLLHYLIQDGCEVDVRDAASQTTLMIVSVMIGDKAAASLLITAGADVNVQDRDGKTPLMVAVLNNYEHLVKILLDRGADPNLQNQAGTSAVQMAHAFKKEEYHQSVCG